MTFSRTSSPPSHSRLTNILFINSFIIKMPWLHRLACFRDDVVFLILLYQVSAMISFLRRDCAWLISRERGSAGFTAWTQSERTSTGKSGPREELPPGRMRKAVSRLSRERTRLSESPHRRRRIHTQMRPCCFSSSIYTGCSDRVVDTRGSVRREST